MGGRGWSRAAGGAATIALSLAVAGCIAPTEPLPRKKGAPTAPGDGELAVYDVVTSDGTPFGRTARDWGELNTGVGLSHGPADVLDKGEKPDGAVVLRQGEVVSSWRGSGDAEIFCHWEPEEGRIRVTAHGADTFVTVPPGTRDNDEMLESLRFADLPTGRSVRVAIFNSGPRAWIPAQIDALGTTEVTVPVGTFSVRDVRVGFGTQYHHAFIEVDPPHRLLRYDNASGSRLVMRSYRAAGTKTPVETGPVEVPKATPKLSLVLAVVLAQWPLMIGLPVLLAFRLRKKLQLPWSVWGLGALGFVLSQVVHLPLNWALGLMGSPRAIGMASPPVVAAALGLTAGLCEEVTRWLVLRRLASKGQAGVRVGLVAGAGHGGVEALIFGCLAGATAISMWTVPYLPPSWVGMPPEAREAFAKQVLLYWSAGWAEPIFGGIERVSAMLFHIGMSVLIARGVERGRALAYVGLAIAAHAAFDGAVVYAVPRVGIFTVEVATLAASVVIGALVARALRRSAS